MGTTFGPIVRVALLAALGVFTPTHAVAQDDELASPKLRIAWDDFRQLYDAGNVVVIDVRDSASFVAGHIPGARSVPLPEIEKSVAALKRIRKPIVLYCA